jgi:two-component system, NarL family, sensor histidine kinase DevS
MSELGAAGCYALAVTDQALSHPLSEATGTDFSVVAAIDALDAATRAIAGELDLDRVLQLIVDSVRDLVRARYAALGIVDAGGRIERFITSGISADQRALIGSPPRGHGLLGLIIREGTAFRIPDIAKHPDAYGFPDHHPLMRSFLGVPVRTGGEPIGNFYLTDKGGALEFSDQDQRLVEMFALHAAIAIQNARLHARVQRLAVIDERLRIGRDLHDGIIQGIYAVALSLEDIPELMTEDPGEASGRIDRAIDRLNAAIGDIRTFIVDLGAEGRQVPIGSRLASLADELLLTAESHMALDLDLADVGEVDEGLSAEAATQLILIAREALSNAIRHSGAPRARLSIRAQDAAAVLSVEDNGRGFDPSVLPGAGHFGLANQRERALSIGGVLDVSSRIGGGTRIIVRIPLANRANPETDEK